MKNLCNYDVRMLTMPDDAIDCPAIQFVVGNYHKLESGRYSRFGACGHRIEARSSVAERCRYMAEEGVRILPRLPGRPVPRVKVSELS